MLSPEMVALATVMLGTGVAAAIDLRTRRVPNAVTVTLACTGVALAIFGVGQVGIGAALAGCVVGILVMLPGYTLGATGAGDVKLLAAAGTVLGPAGILWAFVYTAIAGAAIAAAVAMWRGRVKRTLENAMWLLFSRGATRAAIEAPQCNNRFAYAPAIALGAVLAVLGQ